MTDTPETQQYQQDIFTELRADDELVVLARGLGLLHLITNLLHFYDAAGNNLVLVVGANDRENEWIAEGRLFGFETTDTEVDGCGDN